ncbi:MULTISPECIES: hypothetical protein [Acinetobacter]|nr:MULTISPECIES: hypothetical protein [Acinetobacter]
MFMLGYLTKDEPYNGGYDICPVYFLEADPVKQKIMTFALK